MSGQPTKAPSDASKYRSEYLASLALQAKNDDYNLQANKIFKKTGQTPTQQTDYRLTSEKLADIERLKIEVRGELSAIADGQQADAIVNELTDQELVFLAQHIVEIVKDVKPKYKYGIMSSIFISYFRRYMTKAEETNEVGGLRDMVVPELLQRLEESIRHNGVISNMIQNAIIKDIREMQDVLPTRDEIRRMQMLQNAIQRQQLRSELEDALAEMPTQLQMIRLIDELDKGTATRDKMYSEQIAGQIHQLLAIEPATKEQMANIQQALADARVEGEAEHNETQTKLDRLHRRTLEEHSKTRNRIKDVAEELEAVVKPYPNTPQAIKIRHLYETKNGLTNNSRRIVYIEEMSVLVKGGAFDTRSFVRDYSRTNKTSLTNLSTEELKRVIARLNEEARVIGYGDKDTEEVGRGLGGRIRGTGLQHRTDYNSGIMQEYKYVPFGKYHIDQHRLNDDIVAMKRPTGVNVAGFPVQRVSKSLGSVMRSIVGGGQPQFHQLEKLTDEEKLYLHKLARRADISSRISVPTPNKDEDERDVNEFEIMKGELLNGNDSIELVKKFKVLIMKMVRKELLPKGQAKDLLMELASLGY
jgi:hypothetical protein